MPDTRPTSRPLLNALPKSPLTERTPWGATQNIVVLADGMWSVETASHGGIVVSGVRSLLIPRTITPFTRDRHFWEEDFDYIIPLLVFRKEVEEVMGDFDWKRARTQLRQMRPDWYAAVYTLVTQQKEST